MYNRLPFGISTAPSIFQRCMNNVLQGLNGVTVYIDDILVSVETKEEHLANLDAVMQRLEGMGFQLKLIKCSFLQLTIGFLGHRIGKHGHLPLTDKVEAIREAPAWHL